MSAAREPAGAGPGPAGPEPGASATQGEVADAVAADRSGGEAPSRGAAIAMYIVCLAIPIGFFLGPLAAFIIWRVRRDEPFIDFHGRQVLDIVLTAILVAGGLYLAGRIIQESRPLPGVALQWLALAVGTVQLLLLAWGAVTAARTRTRALPASLRILRRASMA